MLKFLYPALLGEIRVTYVKEILTDIFIMDICLLIPSP